MTYNHERRQSSRKRFENLLYVEVEPGNGGMVLNLSEHGFGFRAVRRVRPKQEVKFAFNLDEKRRLEGRGRLEWCDKEGRVAGVQFTDVSEEFLGEIRGWMANAVEYPMRSGVGPGSSSSVTTNSSGVVTATNGHNSPASESLAPVEHSSSTNGQDRAVQAIPGRSVRSITSVPSTISFPLAPETPAESRPSETSNKRGVGGTWTSLPPAVGAERKPNQPGPRMAAQASDSSAATAYKFDPVDHPEVEDPDLSGDDFELAEESNASQGVIAQTQDNYAQDHEDQLVALEDRTARALNEHAQALLQHFQHEEQRTLAAFREAVARVLRDSERQLFPIREAAQAQMKSLESAVASAGTSVKVLDRYPSLLERAQQQALDRFQTQVHEILHAHVMELRRRSETVFEQLNTQINTAGLQPGRIRTSSGIIVTAVLVMLLVGLFVFRREAAGAFIWLGQQMVEPAPVAETAKPGPAPVTKSPVEDTKPPAQDVKPPVQDTKPQVPESEPTEEPKAAPADSETTPKEPALRPQTVKSLWDEVAKGNLTAQLTLGNMYFTGHGVTKNCYQARRLFAAAARKGSLEGKQRLAELDRSTCL